jgi:hypothetical protein
VVITEFHSLYSTKKEWVTIPNHFLVKSVNVNPMYALCQHGQITINQMLDKVAIEAIIGFIAVMWEMLRLQYEKLHIRKEDEFLGHEVEKQEL